MKKINYLAISVFYLIAIFCRFLTNKTGLLNGIESGYLKIILTGIGPALGFLTVFLVFGIKLGLRLQGNYKRVLIPLAMYWILPILLVGGLHFLNKGIFPWTYILLILIYGLLEEIGWRGFLYQELKPLPTFVNIFITTVLWFVWHLNFNLTESNLLFFGILLIGSWGIGKVADLTKSLFAVSAFHSLNNFYTDLDSQKIMVLISLLAIWIGSLIFRKKQVKA